MIEDWPAPIEEPLALTVGMQTHEGPVTPTRAAPAPPPSGVTPAVVAEVVGEATKALAANLKGYVDKHFATKVGFKGYVDKHFATHGRVKQDVRTISRVVGEAIAAERDKLAATIIALEARVAQLEDQATKP